MRQIIMAMVAVAISMGAAYADDNITYSSKNRLNKSYVDLLEGRLSKQYGTPNKRVVTIVRRNGNIPRYNGSSSGTYQKMAINAARRYGIPPNLFLRLINQESRWNPRARSRAGAIGLCQLMPGTARMLGVNPYNPAQNIEGGARYLATQYRRFRSWRLALAAYNAGPGAVSKYGGIPPYRETRNYVRIIMGS